MDEYSTPAERLHEHRERIKELEAQCVWMEREVEFWKSAGIKQRAKVERLEKAIHHCDPLCPAWAALEGKQEKERCPHLAGDLCVKEGACECYGG